MKNSYILLRNNVESSSLELEDLKQIGLQPTDLIWVECQSVCWQNPSEIAELKDIVNKNTSQNKSITLQEFPDNDLGTIETKSSINIKKKLVHIELPSNRKAEENKAQVNTTNDAVLINMNKYGNPNNTTSIKLKTDLLFDELDKNRIPSSTKNEKFEKTFFGIELPRKVNRVAFYICLIAAGAIVMLLILSNDRKTKVAFQPPVHQPEQVVAASNLLEADEEEATVPITESFVDDEYQAPKESEISKEIRNPRKVEPKLVAPSKKIEENKEVAKNNSEIKQAPIEPVTQIKETKKITIENISNQLALQANDYDMGSFGGIKNLEMTLQNNSNYLIDNITVHIKYLNPEGNMVNSEKINFQSINPGESSTIAVKKSKRGVKIDYQIIKIESKEFSVNHSK